MVGTLILLYAINGAVAVPKGCFIAAWALIGVRVIATVVEKIAEELKG